MQADALPGTALGSPRAAQHAAGLPPQDAQPSARHTERAAMPLDAFMELLPPHLRPSSKPQQVHAQQQAGGGGARSKEGSAAVKTRKSSPGQGVQRCSPAVGSHDRSQRYATNARPETHASNAAAASGASAGRAEAAQQLQVAVAGNSLPPHLSNLL